MLHYSTPNPDQFLFFAEELYVTEPGAALEESLIWDLANAKAGITQRDFGTRFGIPIQPPSSGVKDVVIVLTWYSMTTEQECVYGFADPNLAILDYFEFVATQ